MPGESGVVWPSTGTKSASVSLAPGSKYLYLVSHQDRALVGAIEELRARIAAQRRQLLRIQGELGTRRDERTDELSRYVTLERRREQSLRETRASERAAAARLDSLTKDAQRLNDVVAGLERARRAAAAAGAAATAPADRKSVV